MGIYRFMSCPCFGFCTLIRLANNVAWNSYAIRFSMISSISFNKLTRIQHVLQLHSENAYIRVSTTSKGAVHPNDVTALNSCTNFISQTRTFELVTVEGGVEPF